jgi:signal transduction histidine kinase
MEASKPSWIWMASAVSACVLALLAVGTAVYHQRAADRPIGEGQLFAEDATAAASEALQLLSRGTEPDVTVRQLRNHLAIEAVSLLDGDGKIVVSSSPSLVGSKVESGVLQFGLSQQRLAAVVEPVAHPISVDGVEEWPAGSPLYTVLQPMDDGALVLHYDTTELLARRSGEIGIRATTLQLLAVAVFLMVGASMSFVGRSRSTRHHREVALEAALLRRHSRELEITNHELEKARRDAEMALALAEEKSRVRAEFVLMINHELRTPLTSVVTGADLLRFDETLSPEDRAGVIETMIADGRRLEEMIGQMLVVARIENRGLHVALEEVELAEMVAALRTGHPRLDVPQAAVPFPLRDQMVWTDATSLVQLVGSLADNAVTHGARTVTLTCAPEIPFEPLVEVGVRPHDCIYMLVSDDGPGIPPEFLPRIFEKFEKLSSSPGTGLGLYLARMMIEALEASLAVTTSDSGTVMAIAVPVSAAVPSVLPLAGAVAR